MNSIRVAIAGVGNCCSALVQGVYYYRENDNSIGLAHRSIGGYEASDVEFVSAFDVDGRKCGKDLSEAILSAPNNLPKFVDLPRLGVTVREGADMDAEGSPSVTLKEVVEELAEKDAKILLNLVSGDSHKSSKFYAEAAAEAGCAFLNATPAVIASDASMDELFKRKGLPLVGDDLLDQVGATVVHMGLLEFLNSRGARIEKSYQLDVGGGAESLSTLEKTRDLKRKIKTRAVSGSVPYEFPLVSGSTDYVDFLGNQRDSFFWVKGRYFGGAPFIMDVKMGTSDGPNAGSVLLDVIRGLKLALDRKIGGVILPLSVYGFKNTPEKFPVSKAYHEFSRFIEQ